MIAPKNIHNFTLQLTLYEQQGNYEKAAEVGERALKITEQEFGLDDINVSRILLRLGHLYMLQRKFKLAQETLERALAISEQKMGPEHSFTADIIYELGCYYLVKPEDIGVDVTEGQELPLAKPFYQFLRNLRKTQLTSFFCRLEH